MFKLTMIFWLATGGLVSVEADGFKTKRDCMNKSGVIVTDMMKRNLPFLKAATRCEEYSEV